MLKLCSIVSLPIYLNSQLTAKIEELVKEDQGVEGKA
jgi:hypothetical protein